jgi:hypothetical protein
MSVLTFSPATQFIYFNPTRTTRKQLQISSWYLGYRSKHKTVWYRRGFNWGCIACRAPSSSEICILQYGAHRHRAWLGLNALLACTIVPGVGASNFEVRHRASCCIIEAPTTSLSPCFEKQRSLFSRRHGIVGLPVGNTVHSVWWASRNCVELQ